MHLACIHKRCVLQKGKLDLSQYLYLCFRISEAPRLGVDEKEAPMCKTDTDCVLVMSDVGQVLLVYAQDITRLNRRH